MSDIKEVKVMDTLIDRLTDPVERVKLAIDVIRAHDFLAVDVPQSCIDELYSSLHLVSVEQLQEILNEYGENEIGLAIKRTERVKVGRANVLFNELKFEYGRSVVVMHQSYEKFKDPTHVFINVCTAFTVPESWQNLISVTSASGKEGGFFIGPKLTLPCTFPLLEEVQVGELLTEHLQPSLKYLTVLLCQPNLKASWVPRLTALSGASRCFDLDACLPHLLSSRGICDETLTPNLKMLETIARQRIQPHHTVEVLNGRFLRKTDEDVDCDSRPCNHLRDDVRRYAKQRLTIFPTDRQLEFYDCKFRDRQFNNLTTKQAKAMMPNALIL